MTVQNQLSVTASGRPKIEGERYRIGTISSNCCCDVLIQRAEGDNGLSQLKGQRCRPPSDSGNCALQRLIKGIEPKLSTQGSFFPEQTWVVHLR